VYNFLFSLQAKEVGVRVGITFVKRKIGLSISAKGNEGTSLAERVVVTQ